MATAAGRCGTMWQSAWPVAMCRTPERSTHSSLLGVVVNLAPLTLTHARVVCEREPVRAVCAVPISFAHIVYEGKQSRIVHVTA